MGRKEPIEKWIDLSDLPRKGKLINWKESIRYKCKFKYDNIKGELEIVDYNYPKITIKYLNYDLFKIRPAEFVKCNFGKFLKIITNEFKIEIGQTFKDNKRDLTIIDREYKIDNKNIKRKYCKYHCNKCGNEDWIGESNLLKSQGCNICNARNPKVKLGFNTIYDKTPWMIGLGVSKEDSKIYTPQSNQKIKVICPYCGKKKEISPCTIYKNKSIFCSCGDGKSYPEKFIISLLDQLNIEYKSQYSPEWIKPKRYDFYFELGNEKYIIEVNGGQHYNNKTFSYCGGRTLKEEKQNDQYKKYLALNNGIDCYIELDCSKSELYWIKNSILNSELNKIFDLSQIDWLKCEEFALSNRVKEVCDYWHLHNEINNEELTTKDLSEIFKLSRNTITSYLKQGNNLGWCNYNSEKEIKKGRSKYGKNSKQVEVFKNGKSLGVFSSCSELERQSEELFGVKFHHSGVSQVARCNINLYKGFTFKYL